MNSSTSNFRAYTATLLALIALAVVGGLSLTEWMVRHRVEPSDVFTAHVRLFHSADDRDAAFGDSHAICGFDPPPGMLNLAFAGENIGNIVHKARAYFAQHPPGRVILQADAHMFAGYRMADSSGYNELFDAQANHSAWSLHALTSYHRPKLLAYWDVWLREGAFTSKRTLSANGWTDCGDRWTGVDPETRTTRARARTHDLEPVHDFATSAAAAEYRQLVRDLSHLGAQLCMVEFPVTAEYEQETANPRYQEARAWFAALARREGIRYLPYAGIYTQRAELFGDQDHLNARGAREFSDRIVRDCFPTAPSSRAGSDPEFP